MPNYRYRTATHRLGVVLLYVVSSAIALGVNPFRGQTTTPFDLLISQSAWSFVNPGIQVRQWERSDVLDARLPQWLNARQQIRDGHFPVWDDTRSGGVQEAPLTGSLLTPSFLVFLAATDPATGFYLAILLSLVIAGVGMHCFLRRYLGLVAAIVGAISFELCGFHTAWLYWPHVQTSIWAPWLLLAVARCANRPSMKSSIGIALASAMVILGGFPFVGMMVFGASSLYALTLCVFQWRSGIGVRRLVGWYSAGIVFGFALCAVPLIGFILWIGQYQLGYRQGGSGFSLYDLRLMFAPWAYRAPRVEHTLYVGMVVTVLALLSPALMLLQRARLSPLPIFGLALLVVSAGLVFGLWPMWLAGKVPGMSSNSWTRAICILDLALVILGAWMLDRLWKLDQEAVRKWRRVAVGLLAVVQVVEAGVFFRAFNGPVSKAYFYPSTPAISYLQQHMGHFDYVIADQSFLVSGTLQAYGLREWFAHSFRDEALRAALRGMADRPFTTPTASRLVAEDIKLSSPTMAVFNVRYVAVSAAAEPFTTGPSFSSGLAHKPLPPMPLAHRYTQRFELAKAHSLTGVSVRLATYRAANLGGTVILTLIDRAGRQLATVTRPARTIIDNDMAGFYFQSPLKLAPGTYAFLLSFDAQGETRPLTAWTFIEPAGKTSISVDGHDVPGTMEYRLHGGSENSPFKRVFSSAAVTILENTHSPDGPYFLSAVGNMPTAGSGRDIKVTRYRSDRFTLDYAGRDAGYVIVPMNMRPDWSVLVNGAPCEVVLKRGLMPAVPVSGPARITFSYRSPVAQWFVPWMFMVGIMLLLMVYADKRMQRSVDAGSGLKKSRALRGTRTGT